MYEGDISSYSNTFLVIKAVDNLSDDVIVLNTMKLNEVDSIYEPQQ